MLETLADADLVNQQDKVPSHELWDQLLKKHVKESGLVNYQSFQQDYSKLSKYLKDLADHPPTSKWKREEILAYYINLYNAGTVQLILDNYPLASIRDIKRPWDQKILRMGSREISLGMLEHELLRKMDEPRIHFAINCASYSCPKLVREAFTARGLDKQLEQATLGFIKDPARNKISAAGLELSKIFKWYKGDFTVADQGLVEFLNRYLDTPLNTEIKINYLPYNWDLNEIKTP
ncbi:DUF547 domain-containing protein [Robiginitalea sp. IMCC43444]|uniref:DUF547 domain-containing protein n=1 Tax=Robiginitalea sp. IMCC43444 TaxID=3459121 RepID=UPI004042A89A